MNASPAVAALIRAYEPYQATPQDGLIGWGHVITGEYEHQGYANGITLEEAEKLLNLALLSSDTYFNIELSRLHVPLQQHEYDALVSLHVDVQHLGNSFLIKYVMNGDKVAIAREFDKWGVVTKKPARRAAESRLFLTGAFE